jgi:hypothetical protein
MKCSGPTRAPCEGLFALSRLTGRVGGRARSEGRAPRARAARAGRSRASGADGPTMEGGGAAFARVELSGLAVQFAECLVDAARDGSCTDVDLETITDDYLVTIRRLRDEGSQRTNSNWS